MALLAGMAGPASANGPAGAPGDAQQRAGVQRPGGAQKPAAVSKGVVKHRVTLITGDRVGVDAKGRVGLPTTWYRVVQDKYGGVITMHPIPKPVVPR
ncbi:hypothetical protein [Streptomyces thermocarboxydovorans]|uniref:hypothetical protein n=1 Tax=Streptomyces thermocarboxydovorans TaxID=59298 RepID=UPI0031D580FF